MKFNGGRYGRYGGEGKSKTGGDMIFGREWNTV
jgi:hypothetical protein